MECIIFVGLPASGKSTFYQQCFFHTHLRINLDMLRTRRRESILLQACIQAGQPFVVDNTNITRERRAPYIALAKDAGFRVVGYYFSSKVADCIARNSLREGKSRVPDKAILRFSRELHLPTSEEGFDALYYVSIDPEQGFISD